jgi:hypothetical protein
VCRARVEAASKREPGGQLAKKHELLKQTERTRDMVVRWRRAMLGPNESSRATKAFSSRRPVRRARRAPGRARRRAGSVARPPPEPDPDPANHEGAR